LFEDPADTPPCVIKKDVIKAHPMFFIAIGVRPLLRKAEPEAEHSWLCDGSLLKLDDAISPHNMKLFQSQWARGQPVIISNSNEYLDYKLWHPKAFCKDFGHLRADLVNTLTGKTVPKQPLKWFWEGFEKVSCRPLDSDGTPMLLKLKDWPPEEDIAKYIPRRFHNLVHDFPIQPYTLREGNCNLASYIPDLPQTRTRPQDVHCLRQRSLFQQGQH